MPVVGIGTDHRGIAIGVLLTRAAFGCAIDEEAKEDAVASPTDCAVDCPVFSEWRSMWKVARQSLIGLLPGIVFSLLLECVLTEDKFGASQAVLFSLIPVATDEETHERNAETARKSKKEAREACTKAWGL